MTDKQEGNKPPKFTSNRGQAKRSADYNEWIREKGIIQITVRASEEARPLFNAAAKLIRDGSEPGDAFRIVAGSNAPDGGAALPDPEQQREQHRDFTEREEQQYKQFAEIMEAVREGQRRDAAMLALLEDRKRQAEEDREQQRKQQAELLRTLLERPGQGDAADLADVLAALQRLEALAAGTERQRVGEAEHLQALAGLLVTIRRDQQEQRHENLIQTVTRESQRPGGPDHIRALAALVVTIRRDREQQHQQHRELLRIVRRGQGQRDAGGSAEVLAALQRLEGGHTELSRELLEAIDALAATPVSLEGLDDLTAKLDDLEDYDAQQLEGIKALAETLSSLDGLDDLAARLDDLRADSAQHVEAVKELAAALAPLESVVDGLVAAQEADKEVIDKLRDLLTPMVRLSFAIQAGEKDPVTGWRALVDKVKKRPG